MIGLGAISLYALGAVATSYGLGAALMGKLHPEAPKEQATKKASVRLAVAAQKDAPKRIMVPEKIAFCVVEYLRDEGLNAYPLIPEDLDETINLWCDDVGVERISTQRVRELIALLPGVSRTRFRLATNHPINRYVRNRMIARKHAIGEKATAYVIADRPWVTPYDTPENAGSHLGSDPTDVGHTCTSGTPPTHLRQTRGRTHKTSDRTYVSDVGNSDIRMEAA